MSFEQTTLDHPQASSSARKWRHGWDVLTVLTRRDIKAQYKRSFLGFGWALGGPLLQVIVFSTIFKDALGTQVHSYPCYVFVGVLVWGWFQSSLGGSVSLITGNFALARQPRFPLAMLPFVTVNVRFLHMAIALPLMFILLWCNGIYPTVAWLALPGLAVIQYLLCVGLAYPLASLNVLHRDTQHIVSVLLQLMMFVTPIFYRIEVVPEAMRNWFYLNPMVSMVAAWRSVLLDGVWPEAQPLWILGGIGLFFLVLGRKMFIAQSHRFVEEM
ncbi:ABC transporter permease [Haloferula sp. BvORR071]|uniref:ABC transporter permease n=1 Tax=Haloferula sp. BvORR071 TaxID=1396141 RepID=UPI00069722A0|nr:ABC transporter permease [Haloferula sp. BvORR071]